MEQIEIVAPEKHDCYPTHYGMYCKKCGKLVRDSAIDEVSCIPKRQI